MSRLLDWRVYALTAFMLSVLGCGVIPPTSETIPQQAESPEPKVSAVSEGNQAVLALVDTAQNLQLAGNFDQAAAALERALRLEPRNAMLWHRLAQIRLSQGKWRDAIDLASKSNSLAGGKREIQASNWLVIAQAKERQGDREGARAAREHIQAGSATQ
jgi:predicted Zn-dependent protease